MLKKMRQNKLNIKEDIQVFSDTKTKAKSIALPFRLSDGTSAVCIITRLKNTDWAPQKEIKNIIINYYEDSTT